MIDLACCPSQDELIRMACGDMPLEQFESVCQHVESCDDCQIRLSELDEPTEEFTRSLAGLSHADLEKARIEIDAEAHETATSIRDFFGLGLRPADKLTTLTPPCQLGPYEIRRLIGHGGMGEVYEARHVRLDRLVAIKVIRGYRQEDPVSHAHFLKEMTTTGKFDHPNLVRAYDAWEEDSRLYLVLELLDGHSVQSLARDAKAITAEDVVEIMIGACQALEHLHANHMIHCDVKPANVMRLQNGAIKLIDFGLAVSKDPTKSNGRITAGTKGYASPEQAIDEGQVDHRSDIYSAGCVLKFLIGQLVRNAVHHGNTKWIQRLCEVSDRMTQVNPDERYQSISEVITDLEFLKTRGSEPTTRLGRRDFKWLALIALVISGFSVYGWRVLVMGIRPFELKMVEIPAGQFVMGGIVGDPETRANELPRRTVEFTRPFKISTYEITVGQFREFVDATGYRTEAEVAGQGGWKATPDSSWGEQANILKWSNPGYPIADSLPVTVVTYADSLAFCKWLSQRDGRTYRLPTEAEWEYACRAGTTGAYHFPFEARDAYCWTQFNVKETARPRPVGIRQPNTWGLFDMCGNVREWCMDWYADKAYEMLFKDFPNGPATGDLRVIRGGCFMDKNAFMMSSHRGYLAPTQALNNQGFRVVQELP